MFYDDLTGADGQPPNAQEMAQRRQANQAAADPGLWERAEAHNPDPARFCPVQVTPPLRLSLTPTPTLSLSLSLTRGRRRSRRPMMRRRARPATRWRYRGDIGEM